MRAVLCAIAFVSLVVSTIEGSSEPATKALQVGVLLPGPSERFAARLQIFRESLRKQGFIEDQRVTFITRYAPDSPEQLKQSAAELVSLPVNVIFTFATMATEAARHATKTIPIVFAMAADPIGSGFVTSFEKPGGNITGVADNGAELAGKRLEALKEAAPQVSRVAVIGNSSLAQQAHAKQNIERVAKKLGIELLFPNVRSGKDLPAAFQKAEEWGADGYINLSQTLTSNEQQQIANLAEKSARPLVVHTPAGAEAGASILSMMIFSIFSAKQAPKWQEF